MSHGGRKFRLMSLPMLIIKLVFVGPLFQEDVYEDILGALLWPTNTIDSELFKSSNDYNISRKLKWSLCVSICMDGAAAIMEQLPGFTTQIKEVTSECEFMSLYHPYRKSG